MNNKKILFLIPDLKCGGSERVTSLLCNFGSKRGYTVFVLTYDSSPNYFSLEETVKHIRLNLKSKTRVGRLFERKKKISSIIESVNPDIIFAPHFHSLFYCAGLFGRKVIIGSERSSPYKNIGLVKKIIRNSLFRRCSAVIFQTNGARDYYKKLKIKKTLVVQNPVDDSFFLNGHCDSGQTITSVGNLKPEKDYQTLITAFSISRQKHPEIELNIVGDGPELKNLQHLCKTLNVFDSVHFLGRVKNVSDVLFKTTIFVLSSKYEGMPNSLLEAMCAGLPCISTNCRFGPADIISHKVDGLLVDVGEPKSLSESINLLLDNKEFRETLSFAALNKRLSNSSEAICNKYYLFFEELL